MTRVAGALLGNRERWPRLLQQLAYLVAMLVMSWTLWQERKQYDVLQVCQFSLLVLPLAIVCHLAGKGARVCMGTLRLPGAVCEGRHRRAAIHARRRGRRMLRGICPWLK